LSHGAKTFLENPPPIDINISHWGAVSEHVKAKLASQGIKRSQISVVNNIVDQELFDSFTPINKTPKKAVIISNRMKKTHIQRIKQACHKQGIKVVGVGTVFNKRVDNSDMPKVINYADIVFTIGRGVVETMMCGRIPIVFDSSHGGDGMLTTKNFKQSAANHFNGSYKHKYFTQAEQS
jgi:O-antigen biosynthesis protein